MSGREVVSMLALPMLLAQIAHSRLYIGKFSKNRHPKSDDELRRYLAKTRSPSYNKPAKVTCRVHHEPKRTSLFHIQRNTKALCRSVICGGSQRSTHLNLQPGKTSFSVIPIAHNIELCCGCCNKLVKVQGPIYIRSNAPGSSRPPSTSVPETCLLMCL